MQMSLDIINIRIHDETVRPDLCTQSYLKKLVFICFILVCIGSYAVYIESSVSNCLSQWAYGAYVVILVTL